MPKKGQKRGAKENLKNKRKNDDLQEELIDNLPLEGNVSNKIGSEPLKENVTLGNGTPNDGENGDVERDADSGKDKSLLQKKKG